MQYLLTIPFALSDDNIIQICSVSLVVQCRTPFTKRVTKKRYFPFPTAVYGATGMFTVTFDETLLSIERLYSTLFERAKYYFKKSRLRKSAFCFA